MTLREKFIKSAMGSCRHFNGIQNKKCVAGVEYEAAGNIGLMPCIPRLLDGKQPWACTSFEIMSIADAEKEADERLIKCERGVKARHAAKDDAKAHGYGKGHGGVGAVPCPGCTGGTLRYSVAGYNGHMHGKCTTAGCVSWME